MVEAAGAAVLSELGHPAFGLYEELYRALPDGAWFDPSVSPSSPIQFELGAFVVPSGQNLWLFDYEFSVFRQSGVDPGDIMRAEDSRFSAVLGFDINFSGRRDAHLLYQLDPMPTQRQRPTFDPRIGQPQQGDAFNRSAFQSFAANASPGTSLLPARPNTQGPRNGPFTLIAVEGDRVSLNCVIFRPVPTPVACIEARSAGFLLQTQLSQHLLQQLRPR